MARVWALPWSAVVCFVSIGARADPLPSAAAPERASAARVILLVRSAGDDAVMTRLRAELLNDQWRLLEIRRDEREAPLPLAAIAEGQRVSAALRFDAARRALELWVLRPQGPIEESLSAPDAPVRDRVLALRAAEALRASGLSLGPPGASERAPESVPPDKVPGRASSAPRAQNASNTANTASAPRAQNAPNTSPRARVEPSLPRAEPQPEPREDATSHLWASAGPGVTWSPGGLGALVVAIPGVRLELERWSFSVFGVLPLKTTNVAGVEGRARVATWMAGAAVDLEWARLGPLGFHSGLGLGGALTSMRGDAAPGYLDADDRVYAATALLRSSAVIDLGRAWRLNSALLLGGSLPRTRVQFDVREAAHWGLPYLGVGVALEASLVGWRN